MLNYFFLCSIAILTGIGILKLLRIPLSISVSIYLSPIVTMSFWTLFLGWGVLFRYPIKNSWQLGWSLTLLFAAYGFYSITRFIHQQLQMEKIDKKSLRSFLFIILLILLLPIITMKPYFSHGLVNYGGSDAPDGWSYIAIGQYLWEYVRGTQGGLAPLHQFATGFLHERFIASALLSFWSPILGSAGDAQTTANLLRAWGLFSLASSCAFFAASLKIKKFIPLYLILVIFSGWMIGLLTANNFANAISLSALPAFAGIATQLDRHQIRWQVLLSILLGAMIFCYPELTPIFIATIVTPLIKQNPLNIIKYVPFIFITSVISLILISPYLGESINFFLSQFHAALQHPNARPGENCFPILCSKHYLSAFWGLINTSIWGNQNTDSWLIHQDFICKVLVTVLTGLTIIGLITLWIEKQRGLVILCVLFLLGYAFMIHAKYPYGAYKFVLLNWWLITFCVIKALISLSESSFKYKKAIITCLGILGFIYFNSCYSMLNSHNKNTVTVKDITPLRKLINLDKIVNDKAILVDVKETVANEWAVYYLRKLPIQVKEYKGYMASSTFMPLMEKSKPVKTNGLAFLLTDNPSALPKQNLIWSSGPYYLWKLPNKYFPSLGFN